MQNDEKKRAELADFLKTRRARLHPEQFGLPDMGRRRTPGLRRDEVAQLAGIGLSWYTWLEQGRAITVSNQVLESLARILQLDAGERNHLFALAQGMMPVPNEDQQTALLPSGLQTVLDALGTSPAYVHDQRSHVVAWNASACRIFGDFALLPENERNMVWQIFAHPASRQLFVDWEQALEHAVMSLRLVSDRYTGDAEFEQFITDLKQVSPEFWTLWAQHDIQESCAPHYEKELNHPQVGRLLLYSTTLALPEAPLYQMIIFTPRVPATAAKLTALQRKLA